MTAKQVRKLSDVALGYTIRDLRETVEVQERNVRAGIPMHKLGDYWDDLHACIGERNRRRKGGCMMDREKTLRRRHNGRHTLRLTEYSFHPVVLGKRQPNPVHGFIVHHGSLSGSAFPYPSPWFPDRDAAYRASYADFMEGGA